MCGAWPERLAKIIVVLVILIVTPVSKIYRPRIVVVRSALILLTGWAVYYCFAQSGAGTLRVEIVDKSGRGVPAMICITSRADNTWRTPPNGQFTTPFSTVRDFHNLLPWKPGDIGPVRLTTGDFKDNNKRMLMYDGLAAYPFWSEPAAYFVSRPFSIQLPAGKWRLAVYKGLEFLPAYEEFEIATSQSLERKIQLSRWVDMPAKGWYSGDPHVHYERMKPEHDELLLTWSQAEDVHLTNILSYGDFQKTYMPQRVYGKESHVGRGDYMLVSGNEDPRENIAEQGHVLTLNITAPVRDRQNYHLYDTAFDGVHAQGGLAGYAHVAWASWFIRLKNPDSYPTWDPSINAIKGKADFFEILQFRHLGLDDYYDFLNLGVRIAATAGSDVPWGATIGEVRTFAYTGRNFSADAWFAALKQGHTFVTNGPMLTLSVNDAIPGDELRLRRNGKLRILAEAWAPEAIGAPKTLELIGDGRVIATARARGPKEGKLRLPFQVGAAANSMWIAARVTAFNGAVAHTSPVYIIVDGASFADRTQVPELVAKRLKVLDFIAGRIRDSRFTGAYPAGEVEALSARLEEARKLYRDKLR
jgi:hypothetical protein